MLRSRDNLLYRISIPDLEYPCASALPDDRPRLPVESPVGHAFLDTRFDHDVNPLPDLELLNHRGYRGDTASSEVLLELIPRLLAWSIVMCHKIYSPLLVRCSDLHHIEADNTCGAPQDLGKAGLGSAAITRYQFLDVEACFTDDFDPVSVVLCASTLDIDDLPFPNFICPPV